MPFRTAEVRALAPINRRQLVAGAVALLGKPHLRLAFAAGNGDAERGGSVADKVSSPPRNLLSATYTPSMLSRSLSSASEWHPYPKVDEREAWEAVPQDIRSATMLRADAANGTEWDSLQATAFLEFVRAGASTAFERRYFARRQRLTDLVLAECMEGESRFVDDIANGVWLTCEETFWGIPAHLYLQKGGYGLPNVSEPVVDLFAAETAATLSWVHYLLGGRLDAVSPRIRLRIQTEVKRRVLDPAFERSDFWWMGLDGTGHRLNNWNPWINSNWMVANLLLEPDSSRRASAMEKICSSLDRYLAEYSPDGGCEEGPVYWGVGAGAYFDCCATLASATGGAGDVLATPFIAKMARYIADAHIADQYYVNYGDAHAKDSPSPELVYRFGRGVEDKVLPKFGSFYAAKEGVKPTNGRLPRELPDILIAAKARNSQKADAMERDAWYPALGLMTTRAKAGIKEGFYLAAQAARNNRSHGHNDSGSFIVFHNGEPVLIDVGVEAYTSKTFSPERYSIWTMQSAYHNLPTVGGVMQQGDDDKYRASDVAYASDDARASLSMNLATAYPPEAGIRSWLREITLEREAGFIRLTENFQLRQKASVALSLMTPRVPSLDPKGSIALAAPASSFGRVTLRYDPSLMNAAFEKIELKDQGLRQTWGNEIYRILLNSIGPIDGGAWVVEIRA